MNKANRTKLLMRLAMGVLCFSHSQVFAGEISKRIQDAVVNKENSIQADLLEADLKNIFNLNVNVDVAVIPNKDKKSFTRKETLDVSSELNPSLQTGPVQLFAKSIKDRQIEIFRQFDSPADAYNYKKFPTVTWKELPYSAKAARKLDAQTRLRFKSRMAFEVGLAVVAQQGLKVASGSVGALFFGDIQVEVQKQSHNKMKLRLLAQLEKSAALSAKLGLRPNFQIFGLKKTSQVVNKKLALSAAVQSQQKDGQLFVLEYLFDLNIPEAALAYNQLMNPARWKNLKEVIDVSQHVFQKKNQDLQNLVDFTLAEEASLKPNVTGVQRLEKAEVDYKNEHKSLSADIVLTRSSLSQDFVEMDIHLQNAQREESSFRLSNFTIKKEISFLKDIFKKTTGSHADAVLKLKPKAPGQAEPEIEEFLGLVISHYQDEKTRRESEQREIRATLHRMIPEAYHDQFALDKILSPGWQREARTEIEVLIHKEAFAQGSRLSSYEIRKMLEEFIKKLKKDANWPRGYYGNTWGRHPFWVDDNWGSAQKLRYRAMNPWLRSHGQDIAKIMKLVPQIFSFDSSLTAKDRWRTFTALRKNYLFRKIGTGILTRIVHRVDCKDPNFSPEDSFITGMGVSMKTTFRQSRKLKTANTFEVQFGEVDRLSAYSSINRLRNRVIGDETL